MDTKNLMFPKPKDKKRNRKQSSEKIEKDFCIMPPNNLYEIKRTGNLKRHEVFFGSKQRQLSIKYGLVIFLTDERHNMSDEGIHFNKEFDLKVKIIAQKAFMSYYHKTEEDFIKIFGKSYI